MLERDVYRTPGREPDAPRVPPPSFRRLVSPLGWGLAAIGALLAPLVAFNAVFDPDGGNGFRETRPIPAVDRGEDLLMLLLLATVAVMVAVLVRRVVPIWKGLRRKTRALYVAALLALQTAATVGAEAVAFVSRGGLHLFEPTLSGSTSLPDGRTAYVYANALFGVTYDVYVAERSSFLMRKKLRVSRDKLETTTPRVRDNGDGSFDLVDAAGQRLEPQPSSLFMLGGGC